MNTPKRLTKAKWIIAALLGAVLIAVGGGAAYASHYSGRALPRTTIAGQDVGGMNRDELTAFLNDRLASTQVTATIGSSSVNASLKDLGTTVDVEKTADAIIGANSSVLGHFTALFNPSAISVVSTSDDATLKAFVDELAKGQGDAPVSATVAANADGGFDVTPATEGVSVDPAPLQQAAARAASTLTPQNTALEIVSAAPPVTTEQAQRIADDAKRIAALPVKITDGIDDFEPTPAEHASFVKLPAKDEAGTATIDADKVTEWVKATAEKSNVKAIPAINNVDAAGTVLVESTPGKKGLTANNANKIAAELIAALGAGTEFSSSFDYDEAEAPAENRPAMAGYESYAYPMHEGEKWIDVNLSTNRLTAYEGQTVAYDPIPINHGSPGHETVTGTYHIYLKYAKQDMGCTPGWSYCAKDVPWVSYFTGSYAIHGAPWVSSFGHGSVMGSHGCVNLPVPDAEWIYTWAPSGTAVVTHY